MSEAAFKYGEKVFFFDIVSEKVHDGVVVGVHYTGGAVWVERIHPQFPSREFCLVSKVARTSEELALKLLDAEADDYIVRLESLEKELDRVEETYRARTERIKEYFNSGGR